MRTRGRGGAVGRLLGLLLLLPLLACGKGAVFLTIEATGPDGVLRVPEDVDRVAVKVLGADEAEVLLDKEYPLTQEQRFPLTLGLEPGPSTGERIRVEVRALLGEQLVGAAAAAVTITAQQESSVTVRIVKD